MNERLLQLRKSLKLSQVDFARKLGVTGAGISKIESGERNLTDTMIKLICSTWNVSEMWLNTGEGEMFISDPDLELAYMMGALHAEGDEFKTAFITEMLKLDDDIWAEIKNFINNLVEKQDMREER